MRPDGVSVLGRKRRSVVPQNLVPVSLSGVARPGETMSIVPGAYLGHPEVQLSHRLLRNGVADETLKGLSFALTDADLGTMIEVIETASNAAGTVQTAARIGVAVIAPTLLTLSAVEATLDAGTDLPADLAALGADGTRPLTWSVTGAEGHVAIDTTGAIPMLRLLKMPQPGDHALTITAANAKGSAEAAFTLVVASQVLQAPPQVCLLYTSPSPRD